MGWLVNATLRYFTVGNDPVPIVQKAGWALGPVWLGEISPLIGFRTLYLQPVASRDTDWAIPAHHLHQVLRLRIRGTVPPLSRLRSYLGAALLSAVKWRVLLVSEHTTPNKKDALNNT
jgi:hypothetical protein